MKTSSRGHRVSGFKWAFIFGAVTLLAIGVAGGGFWWSCERQSETYDLSQLSRQPGAMPLEKIPSQALDRFVTEGGSTEKLAAAQFGLSSDDFRTRTVRGMVAALIEQKFSPREITAFYLNGVAPGVAVLQRMAASERSVTPAVDEPPISLVANITTPAPSVASVPAAIDPAPPEATPMPVRRAVAVAPTPVPVRRAMPVVEAPIANSLLADGVPVRRARPVSNGERLSTPGWVEVGNVIPRARPVASVQISPQPIYRIAVIDR